MRKVWYVDDELPRIGPFRAQEGGGRQMLARIIWHVPTSFWMPLLVWQRTKHANWGEELGRFVNANSNLYWDYSHDLSEARDVVVFRYHYGDSEHISNERIALTRVVKIGEVSKGLFVHRWFPICFDGCASTVNCCLLGKTKLPLGDYWMSYKYLQSVCFIHPQSGDPL